MHGQSSSDCVVVPDPCTRMLAVQSGKGAVHLEPATVAHEMECVAVKDLCRRHGFSEASYYLWRSKFGGMSVPEARRLKELEAENTRLKKLLAEQMFENDVIKDALRKKW